MKRLSVYATLLALVLAGIWAIGRASDIASERRTRTEMLEENAVTVALAFKHRRDSVMAATDAQADVVADVSRTTDRAAQRLTVTLADARAALADSAATMETLRIQLANTVFAADTLLATLAAERIERETLEQRHADERRVLLAGFAETRAADARVIDALKSERCRVLWMECPTRTQVAIGSVLTTVVAVLVISGSGK